MSITCEDAVRALKKLRTAQTAKTIAQVLGTDSRAVATALRGAVADGRVTIRWHRGLGLGARYRFIRLTAKVKP